MFGGIGMNKNFNWKRGLLRTTLLLTIILSILGFFIIDFSAFADKKTTIVEVIVQPGDTLWSIANRYDENKIDIRKLIYEIKTYNDIDAHIFPGQVIYIPLRY